MQSLKLTIEPVSAFNGLDVLVARDEGMFEQEGLEVKFASRSPDDVGHTEEGELTQPATSQGRLVNRGQAAMFQG